ncbi:hypothetical protein ACHAWF_008117 [Thalassiosira exigua]
MKGRLIFLGMISLIISLFSIGIGIAPPLHTSGGQEWETAGVGSCLERRGQNGTWVPAPGYDYASGDGGEGFANYTMWTWRDRLPQCQLRKMTKQGICGALESLRIGRVFFVGDSLTNQMVMSFWKLLTQSEEDPGRPMGTYSRRFECGIGKESNKPFAFYVAFTRNDDLSNVKKHTVKEYLYYDNPWVEQYNADPTPTLLIANTGMHQPDNKTYQRDFEAFVRTVEGADRPADLIAWRTNHPGHYKCQNNSFPLSGPWEFEVAEKYNWRLVGGYNDYAKRELRPRLLASGGRWMVLDVHPMTILRPDGHNKPPSDCLHYKVSASLGLTMRAPLAERRKSDWSAAPGDARFLEPFAI